MVKLKQILLKALSIGVTDDLPAEKKLALQLAALDAYWTVIALVVYAGNAYVNDVSSHLFIFLVALAFIVLGIWMLRRRHYNLARFITQFTSIWLVFLTVDASGPNSGNEFFYFTNIVVPFVIFTFDEFKKGLVLTAIATATMLVHVALGPGQILPLAPANPEDKVLALIFVVAYVVCLFTVGRWQLDAINRRIKKEKEDIVHSSNIISIGEMFAGMAHEISNPLQSLSLHLTVLRNQCAELGSSASVEETLAKIEAVIFKVGKIVQGLKDLSRNEPDRQREHFNFAQIVNDVLTYNTSRLQLQEIALHLRGDSDHSVYANPIQLSQVLINLMNNACEAVANRPVRWIRFEFRVVNNFLEVALTDSGTPPAADVITRMTDPFFSTKGPKGTGLGLSISKSMIEKNGGSLYFDSGSSETRFVFLVPLSEKSD